MCVCVCVYVCVCVCCSRGTSGELARFQGDVGGRLRKWSEEERCVVGH